jgi:hypothetical protein
MPDPQQDGDLSTGINRSDRQQYREFDQSQRTPAPIPDVQMVLAALAESDTTKAFLSRQL